MLRQCVECDRTLRPGNWTAKDYPGTFVHVGKNLCQRCKGLRATMQADLARNPAPVRMDRDALSAWLKKMRYDAHQAARHGRRTVMA